MGEKRRAMGQERNHGEIARGAAVQSLKNELQLAVSLLRGVKEAREMIAMEAQAVESARSAFRHAVTALERMPQLEAPDMEVVQRLIDEFRSALSDLGD
jgi:hypothetical protein